MSAQPYSSVFSNHISEDFPELYSFIEKNYYFSRVYRKNDVIQLPNDTDLYFIKSGSIKSFIGDDSGVDRLMYIMMSDTITFSSIHSYFMKTLIAGENNTELLSIRRANLYPFLMQDARYIQQWEKIITSRYGILLQNILLESHCSSKYKVYSFLLQLIDRHGKKSKDNTVVTISNVPSITDIANITGVHRSNATTYINELRDQQVLKKDGTTITILDLHLFQQIVASLDSTCNH